MKQIMIKVLLSVLFGFAFSLMWQQGPLGQFDALARAQAQVSSVVTVTYNEPINVRSGPSTVYYDVVGRVFPGDVLTGLGVSPGREWVQVSYPAAPGGVGWLYATYVSVSGAELQVVEPPPTKTPLATTTINPTFAAAFIFQPTSTRMPTFTPPPPLEIPQYPSEPTNRPAGMASGSIALSLLALGFVLFILSFLLGRR